MTLLFYAVAGCGEKDISGTGLGSQPLRGIGGDDVVAVVTEHDRAPARLDPEALWSFESVVESLMHRHPILPARFGSVFEDEQDVREMVKARGEELREAFARVRGAIEISVRLDWNPTGGTDANPEPSPESGTAYLIGKLDQQQRAERLAARLAPLDALSRASMHRLLPDRATAVRAAYLIDRNQIEEFTERARELDQALDDVQLLCTGPWPPYSFAPGAER